MFLVAKSDAKGVGSTNIEKYKYSTSIYKGGEMWADSIVYNGYTCSAIIYGYANGWYYITYMPPVSTEKPWFTKTKDFITFETPVIGPATRGDNPSGFTFIVWPNGRVFGAHTNNGPAIISEDGLNFSTVTSDNGSWNKLIGCSDSGDALFVETATRYLQVSNYGIAGGTARVCPGVAGNAGMCGTDSGVYFRFSSGSSDFHRSTDGVNWDFITNPSGQPTGPGTSIKNCSINRNKTKITVVASSGSNVITYSYDNGLTWTAYGAVITGYETNFGLFCEDQNGFYITSKNFGDSTSRILVPTLTSSEVQKEDQRYGNCINFNSFYTNGISMSLIPFTDLVLVATSTSSLGWPNYQSILTRTGSTTIPLPYTRITKESI